MALVQADTEVILARARGNITQILGEAKAETTRISEAKRAEGQKLVVDIETEAYEDLKNDLGMDNVQLSQYLFTTRKVKILFFYYYYYFYWFA